MIDAKYFFCWTLETDCTYPIIRKIRLDRTGNAIRMARKRAGMWVVCFILLIAEKMQIAKCGRVRPGGATVSHRIQR